MVADILKTLLINTVVFSVLIGVMLLVRKAFSHRMSAFLRYALWAVVVIKLVIPFGFESALSPLGWFSYSTTQTGTAEGTETEIPSVQNAATQDTTGTQVNAAIETTATDSAYQSPRADPIHAEGMAVKITLDWTEWALIIWFAGAAAMALWLGSGMRQLKRRIRHAQTGVPEHVTAAFEACKEELGVRRHIRIQMQSAVAVPFITGVLKPTLVLPDSLRERGGNDLKHVFTHELTHYRHGDLLVIQALNALNCVYWFNPLVWLCFSMIRSDMETICDQRCLRLAASDGQRGYVETVLAFAGLPAGNRRLHAAMSISDGCSGMEKRIRDMFKPRKTGRRTRALAGLIAALMLATCMLTACQPTPEEEIVVGKGEGLSDLIQATPGASSSTSAQTNDALYTKLSAPKHWSLETTALADKLNITADVDIELPGVSQLPAATASLSEFTQEDLDKIADVLGVGDATWTEIDHTMTKELIEQAILEYKARRAEYEAAGDDELVEHMDDNIEAYEQMYEDAPSEIELKTIEFQIGVITSGEDITIIGFDGTTQVDGQPFHFYAGSDVNGDSVNRITAGFGGFGGVDIDTPYGISLTKEQAAAQASEIAAQLTDELSLCYITPAASGQEDMSRNWGWACVFMREINGCPTAYETTEAGFSLEAVNVPVNYEKMIIVMDDKGMVNFEWKIPMLIESIDNTDVSLLSFDSIAQRAIEQIAQRYADAVSEDIVNGIDWGDPGCTANIISVKLGLMRIAKAGSDDYYYIPVWKFFVKTEHTDEYYERTGMEPLDSDDFVDEDGNAMDINYEYSIRSNVITINALDGSVIDSDLGY